MQIGRCAVRSTVDLAGCPKGLCAERCVGHKNALLPDGRRRIATCWTGRPEAGGIVDAAAILHIEIRVVVATSLKTWSTESCVLGLMP